MKAISLFVVLLAFSTMNAPGQSFSLYLIGDCGEDIHPGPALQLLEQHLVKENERSAVIFLGDNSYPEGLFPEGSKMREESALKLQSQLDRLRNFRGSAIMIPGNHDWKKSKWGGLKQVQEEEKFVRYYWGDSSFQIKNKTDCFLPDAGFPGPASLLLDSTLRIRLIVYDAQWWLQRQWFHKAGKEPGKSYREMSDAFFITLRQMMNEAAMRREQIILAAHHPLMTAGGHGVRKTVPYILATYTPFIIFRPMGLNRLFRQDVTANAYRRINDSINKIISAHQQVIFVSGHDHNLQVFREDRGNVFIVSGAGSKITSFPKKPSATPLWKKDNEPGFLRLTFHPENMPVIQIFTPVLAEGQVLPLN